MITEEMILDLLHSPKYRPMSDMEMLGFFNLKGRESAEFLNLIDGMESEGTLFKTQKGKYVLPETMGFVVGTFSHHKRGFGFLIPDGGAGDVFIGSRSIGGAMNGDKAMARITAESRDGRSREGEIVKIIRRVHDEIVGTLRTQKGYGFVSPDDPRLHDEVYIAGQDIHDAEAGDRVAVKITTWPTPGKNAEGKIVEILGKTGEAGIDIKGLIRQYKLTEHFPSAVLHEAEQISPIVQEIDIKGRRDLRDRLVITIDGSDAKDLDDAVSLTMLDNGHYSLGVHIADVTNYVAEDSELDQEAFERGCSVYLVDRVLPMLPERLSNGICSLNPKTDRLTLSVEIEIDSDGKTVGYEIFESVIRTTERMVYTDVSDMLENTDRDLIEKYGDVYDMLIRMRQLALTLRKTREERGSIDFDFDEPFIILNESGIPVDVEIAERRIGNRIIEEFMLKANEVIAEHFFWMDVPFVYRVHGKPDPSKIVEFGKFVANFGYKLKGSTENIHVRALNDILAQVAEKPEEHIINTIMLRAMKKAVYSTECEGHFGLGVKYYCHFTSPIRRYPDLIIHRIIKEALKSVIGGPRAKKLRNRTEAAAERSSERERVSEEIEREVEKLKKAEYMSYHLGEKYDGVISGVVQSGFFVEIENTIEGMVRADLLTDDFYRFEPSKYRLIGDRTRKTYTIGDKVSIKVIGADTKTREIDFELLPVRIPKSRRQ